MFRPLIVAAGLIGLATPVLAESPASATPGALAGRSPHALYVSADADSARCGKTMHSLPAGKPHTYGLNAFPVKPCAAPELASAQPAAPLAAD